MHTSRWDLDCMMQVSPVSSSEVPSVSPPFDGKSLTTIFLPRFRHKITPNQVSWYTNDEILRRASDSQNIEFVEQRKGILYFSCPAPIFLSPVEIGGLKVAVVSTSDSDTELWVSYPGMFRFFYLFLALAIIPPLISRVAAGWYEFFQVLMIACVVTVGAANMTSFFGFRIRFMASALTIFDGIFWEQK